MQHCHLHAFASSTPDMNTAEKALSACKRCLSSRSSGSLCITAELSTLICQSFWGLTYQSGCFPVQQDQARRAACAD